MRVGPTSSVSRSTLSRCFRPLALMTIHSVNIINRHNNDLCVVFCQIDWLGRGHTRHGWRLLVLERGNEMSDG